jgi:hypothetical protein
MSSKARTYRTGESLVPNGRVIGPIAEDGWALGSIKSGEPKHHRIVLFGSCGRSCAAGVIGR